MKRRLPRFVLVLAIVALAGYAAACGSGLPDTAIAKVGDTYISVEKFDAAVAQEAASYGLTREAYPEYYAQLEKYVAQNLVIDELTKLEAAKLGLSVTDAEIQTQMDSVLTSYYGGDQTKFEAALASNKVTLDQFKTNIKDGLLRDKVRAGVVKDLTGVSEEQIAAYYEANKADYYVEPVRQVRHILIKPATSGTTSATTAASGSTSTTAGAAVAVSTDADWAKALSTAKEVRRKLMAGGSWSTLASQYSGDFQTKDAGGDMGPINLGDTIKAFEDAAFALDQGEISQPVKTVYGYEIIQATSVTKGGQQTLDEVRAQIQAQLLSDAQDEAWDQWVAKREKELGVIYRSDLRPEPTTTTQSTTTTVTAEGAATTTSLLQTTTTAKP